MSGDLITFLRARLDEDERTARKAFARPWIRHENVAGVHAGDAGEGLPFGTAIADCRRVRDGYGVPNADHIARYDPARVLAEVEAKRQIVDEYEKVAWVMIPWAIERATALQVALKALTAAYADHPEYLKEWRS